MRIDRQDYEDSDLATAQSYGCDTIQLKYDGWWVRVVCQDGIATLFSRTNRELTQLPIDPLIYGTFIGEYMFGTQWSQKHDRQGKIFLYDCWSVQSQDCENFPYKERYSLIRANLPLFGDRFRIVQNYSIQAYPEIWNQFVSTGEYEGVVFRRRSGLISDTIHRQKRKVTKDVRVSGLEEGKGKHSSRLGALVCTSAEGVEIRVGGGLDDKDREEIWNNPDSYLGRWLEIEGYAEFESGSLRHPQFIRWRNDLA